MKHIKKFEISTKRFDGSAEIEGIQDDDSYIKIVEGQFEKRFQQLFDKCLPNDAVAFDIGANIGIISVILGKMFPLGKIFAFEGGANVYDVLKNNITRNNLTNVFPYHCAIANYNGYIHFNENSAYGYAIDSNSEIAEKGVVEVSCSTIDQLLSIHSVDRLDLIKLDIEGFEPQALEGAFETIEKFDPIFLMEINPWCIENYGKVDFWGFMQSIFDRYNSVFIVNKNWSEENPITKISLTELVEKINNSKELFVDDIIFSNRGILHEIAKS